MKRKVIPKNHFPSGLISVVILLTAITGCGGHDGSSVVDPPSGCSQLPPFPCPVIPLTVQATRPTPIRAGDGAVLTSEIGDTNESITQLTASIYPNSLTTNETLALEAIPDFKSLLSQLPIEQLEGITPIVEYVMGPAQSDGLIDPYKDVPISPTGKVTVLIDLAQRFGTLISDLQSDHCKVSVMRYETDCCRLVPLDGVQVKFNLPSLQIELSGNLFGRIVIFCDSTSKDTIE
jgi:hypothetical protein